MLLLAGAALLDVLDQRVGRETLLPIARGSCTRHNVYLLLRWLVHLFLYLWQEALVTPADSEIANLRKVLEFSLGEAAHHAAESLLLVLENLLRQKLQPVLLLSLRIDLGPVSVGVDVCQELWWYLVPGHIVEVHWWIAEDWVLHLLYAESQVFIHFFCRAFAFREQSLEQLLLLFREEASLVDDLNYAFNWVKFD